MSVIVEFKVHRVGTADSSESSDPGLRSLALGPAAVNESMAISGT